MQQVPFYDQISEPEQNYILSILQAGNDLVLSNLCDEDFISVHPKIAELFRLNLNYFNKLIVEIIEREMKSE